MEKEWRGHTLKVTGNWGSRYLFLAPHYELWLDEERVDVNGGPRVRPKLEAIVEEEQSGSEDITTHHIEANILSLFGFRPTCELSIDGELVHVDKIRVENILNPLLILFIIGATCWMLYIGPTVLRGYIGM